MVEKRNWTDGGCGKPLFLGDEMLRLSVRVLYRMDGRQRNGG
jgi:hypothetical protein